MKVALLSFDFGEYCIRLASALAREAWVCLFLPRRLAAPHLSQLAPRVDFRPFHKPRLRQPFQQMRTIYAILRGVMDFHPDVIHVQQGHLWFNLALPLLERYPLVLTIHDARHHVGDRGAHNTPQKVLDWGFHRAAQVIVHAEQLKQVVVDELGIPGEIVQVIPHIALGDDAAHSQVQGDDPVILFFGRIWEYKGLEYLIRAEPLITAQVPDATIVIAGQGDDFAAYRRMMVHPERFVVYNEYVSEDKRAELFRQASVVVLPYVDASQSGVIPVAYTFEKPVIATMVGGLPEMVDHGETGYLVAPRDEKALAEAVVRLLQDKDLGRRMGTKGKQKVDAMWSPDVIAHQTLTVYHRAIDSIRLSTGGW